MKTTNHITVPAALAVLLSACAAPMPVQQQLDEMKASMEKLEKQQSSLGDDLERKTENLEELKKQNQQLAAATFASLISAGMTQTAQQCAPDRMTGIATRIHYNFNNMDPVSGSNQERRNREKFRTDLKNFVTGINVPFEESRDKRSFSFVLTDLTQEISLNEHIEDLATAHQVEIPLRVTCRGQDIAFQELSRDYDSVSGVGKASVGIVTWCEDTYTFGVEGIPKDDAEAWVYHQLLDEPLSRGGLGRDHTFTTKYPCEKKPETPPAYIMVVLLKDPPVAQYRKLDLEKEAEEQIPLKSVTKDKPACPPSGVPKIPAGLFKAKLDARGGCV